MRHILVPCSLNSFSLMLMRLAASSTAVSRWRSRLSRLSIGKGT